MKHIYLLSGSTIMGEYWQARDATLNRYVQYLVLYLYDNAGSPVGMMYRNSTMASDTYDYFLFEKNLQGDIVAVYNASGTKLLSYTYDAWGNCTVTGSTTTGAQYNPFRYRGYYFDSELGLYYLNSRYYDANIGRFINADIHINANGDLIGFNLFAYCGNNPIKYVDHTGELIEIPVIVAVSAVALAALTIATVTIVCINTDRAAKKIKEHAQTANIPFESTYSHSVYVLKDGDQIVRYVGRTKQHPEDRLAQHQQDPLHKERKNYKMSVIATGLTYEQARTLEQLLISAFTVQYLDNIRREIAVKNTESYNKYLRALMDIYNGIPENELANLMNR